MADVLAALEELESKNKKPTNTKTVNPLTSSSSRRSRSQGPSSRPTSRPQSRPTSRSTNRAGSRPSTGNAYLTPNDDRDVPSRSPSVASNRRISFAEPPPPPSTRRRLRLTTNKDTLLSGFKFDTALTRYNVSEEEWKDFSAAVIDSIDIPKRARYAWPLYKNEIAKKVKRDLQYEGGDLKRQINMWNRHFRKKGFTVSMEVPGPVKMQDTATPEDKERAAKESKFFRMVLTPVTEKGTSIYSRTSSLTRSVTGEGQAVHTGRERLDNDDDEEEGKDEETGAGDNDASALAAKLEALKVDEAESKDQAGGG